MDFPSNKKRSSGNIPVPEIFGFREITTIPLKIFYVDG